jgi:drug/metabolite transporter (DMT)-like permease
MLSTALWLLNLALDTAGQVAFKQAARHAPALDGSGWSRVARQPWTMLGVGCYGVEFVTWLAFLSRVPLSLAVLLSSINVVTVTLAGRVVFGERGGTLRSTGVLLVAVGVALTGAAASGP